MRTFHYMQTFPTILYAQEADEVFAAMPNSLKRRGVPDCRIAACAISNGYTLVTQNTGDFSEIPGLVLEDWTI